MSTETKTDNGGPAFPLSTSSSAIPEVNGMTLLDHFAGIALLGAMNTITDPAVCKQIQAGAKESGRTISQQITFAAYELAADMIAEKRRRES